MARIFISYAAKDQAEALRVQMALRRHGVDTWSAMDLAAGTDWPESIEAALRTAEAVLVLITPQSVTSRWVQHEWSTALAQSKRVIPALLSGARYVDLPEPLVGIQGVDLDADFEGGVVQIAKALGQLASSGEPPPAAHLDVEAIVEDVVERKLASMGVDLPGPQPLTQAVDEDPEAVFVISSFASDMEPAFEAIAAAAKSVGLSASRVKDIAGDYRITDKILAGIQRARFVVVDLTHERPNVYFELGYARGLGKTVVTIMRSNTEVHFDVRDWTYLEYSDSRPLERDLIERFRYEMGLAS